MTETAKPKRTRKFARTPKGDAAAGLDALATARPPSLAEPAAAQPTKPETKIGLVISLLQRPGGATLEELVAATGWQPHTARAALTGLKKKGHSIAKGKVDGVTRYTITAEARS